MTVSNSHLRLKADDADSSLQPIQQPAALTPQFKLFIKTPKDESDKIIQVLPEDLTKICLAKKPISTEQFQQRYTKRLRQAKERREDGMAWMSVFRIDPESYIESQRTHDFDFSPERISHRTLNQKSPEIKRKIRTRSFDN